MATKIYIDQGHNPQNPNAGAEGNGYREQDLVYEIGVRTAAILRANGLETRLSRPTPQTQLGTSTASSLAARVNDANAWGADYFISLHANASEITSASGSEAFVFSRESEAYPLAENILTELNRSTGLENRGVSVRTNLYVLRRTQMPATLIELGFITNPYDAALMADSPELFAEGVANGVLAYLGML
ncbi:MAG: N-acetylmuramoyl-L-alanine amidase [Eubacteriales bacterium]